MATPTTNSVPVTSVDPAATGLGRYLVAGDKWGGGLGEGVVLTYSFPTGTATHIEPYGTGEFDGWTSLSTGERAAVRSGLSAWSAVANIRFMEVADTATTVGEIRFASTVINSDDEQAHAYYPFTGPEAGDVWFSSANWNSGGATRVAAGSYDFVTILHELGHSLGLKHSFEAPNAIPAALDSNLYSIMSYTAGPGNVKGDNYASFYPTTPMYYDLLAIQALYGRNTSHNAGNSTYTFVESRQYFQAIDDAGGNDKIVYVGNAPTTINLNPGTFSTLSAPIEFTNRSSRGTVTIGPDSVIESAYGGNGNDLLIGNAVGNTLIGNGGIDQLRGGLGDDRLFGAAANDTLYGQAGRDAFYFSTSIAKNIDRLADFSAADDTIYLDDAIFRGLRPGGEISANNLRVGNRAVDANDYIVYDKAHGTLLYDADGSGATAAIKFATLSSRVYLTTDDFIIF